MITRALAKLSRAPEWVRGHFANRGAILAYHRVGAHGADPYGINIGARRFDAHMEILARRAHPMSLAALHSAMAARSLPRGAVAVTLDDGYEDALTTAKPVLERHGVPATCFVVSGQVGNPRGYWWDELHRVIMKTARLPDRLTLDIAGRRHDWPVPVEAAKREALFWELYVALLPLREPQWLAALDRLATWAGTIAVAPASDRTLDARGLEALAEGGLVEIGCHTATHAQLAGFSSDAQLREMRESRATLEDITAAPVVAFAYPHGSFDARSVAAARAAGFSRACTSIPNRVTPSSHALRLPRIGVPDCDAETFERLLGWLLSPGAGR